MPSKPNILLIITDEHNPHIAGYAGNSIVDTAVRGLTPHTANPRSVPPAACRF